MISAALLHGVRWLKGRHNTSHFSQANGSQWAPCTLCIAAVYCVFELEAAVISPGLTEFSQGSGCWAMASYAFSTKGHLRGQQPPKPSFSLHSDMHWA